MSIEYSRPVNYAQTYSAESASTTATSLAISTDYISAYTCVVVVVSRAANFAIGVVTDNSGVNVYTQEVLYNASLPNIAIYVSFTTKAASTVTVHWTAGSRSAVTVLLLNGAGSVGINSGSTGGTGTTEGITATLSSPNNWAIVGVSHAFVGGSPTSQNGNLRVTSAGATSNDYTSIIDNTGSTSVTCSNTYGTSAIYSAVYIELVPATVAIEQFGASSFRTLANVNTATATDSGASPFPNDTKTPNLLVCIVLSACVKSGSGLYPVIQTPSTSGVTWSLAQSMFNYGLVSGTSYGGSAVAIYFGVPSSPLPANTVTTVTVNTNTGANANSLVISFTLLEICGLTATAFLDSTQEGTGDDTTSASTPNLVTTGTDFVLMAAYSENQGTYDEGTGYGTLLGQTQNANIQYNPSVSEGGGVVAAFGLATEGGSGNRYWSCVSAAFGIGGVIPPVVITQPQIYISS